MQYTPNGVLGVVSADGSIDVRSSGSNIDKGSKMRSLNTTEIMVVGGGFSGDLPYQPPGTGPIVLPGEPFPGTPAFPYLTVSEIVVRPPVEIREFLSPDDIWRPEQ